MSQGHTAVFRAICGKLNVKELWDGVGEPGSSIGDAITAAKWFYREQGELRPSGVNLNSAFGCDTRVWFYLVELKKSNAPKENTLTHDYVLRVVILTSGEIIAPYSPANK